MNEAQIKKLLKRAYERISHLEQELEAPVSMGETDIAIVGIGLRFPSVNSLEDLHQVLVTGKSLVKEVPRGRWDIEKWLGGKNEKAKAYTFAGSYLEEIDQFDHHFFNIPPEEAQHTDPQQRMLLELSVEAIQNAGLLLEDLSGSSTGVYIGTVNSGFDELISITPTEYSPTGSIVASAAGKIAYKLNLKGPAISLDTACSSSLTAIHIASNSLLNQEIDYALAGGVNLILSPKGHIGFSQLGAIAEDGRCKTFSDNANGFGRGEGGGIVVLRRFKDAIDDGNRILGVISGSASNHDGQSNGYTAPNQISQESVIKKALKKAGKSPINVGYIETHGTGTSLGDAIELQALNKVFQFNEKLELGSVKANFGHTEYAAGILSLGRALLSLNKGIVYPQIGIRELNSNFKWDQSPLNVNLEDNCKQAKIDVTGISGFGISGTNVHLIVEGVDNQPNQSSQENTKGLALFCSARSEGALLKQVNKHLTNLKNIRAEDVSQYAISNLVFRDQFEYRLVFLGNDKDGLIEDIESSLGLDMDVPLSVNPASKGKNVFLFPGQGGLWQGMAQELYRQSNYFRKTIEKTSKAFEKWLPISISEKIREGSPDLFVNEKIIQPALFSIQIALAKLWIHYGYHPDCVIGISMGEIAAAHIAGSISLDDAVKVIIFRSRYLVEHVSDKKMCLIEVDKATINDLQSTYRDIEISGYYSEKSFLIAASDKTLDEIQKKCDSEEWFCKRAETTIASHCSSVDLFLEDFRSDIQDIPFQPTDCSMFSTAYGRWMKPADYKSSYWIDNIRNPIRFETATKELLSLGYSVFTEISTNPTTSYYFTASFPSQKYIFQATLIKGKDSLDSFKSSINSLYQKGVKPSFGLVDNSFLELLPLYCWDKEQFSIPYDNYDLTESVVQKDQMYLIPEWKPVPIERSLEEIEGELFLVSFNQYQWFHNQAYFDPEKLISLLENSNQLNSTVIIDLFGFDIAELPKTLQWLQGVALIKNRNVNIVFACAKSIPITGNESKLNEYGYGWLGICRSLSIEWELGFVLWVDTDNGDFNNLKSFLLPNFPTQPFCIRNSETYQLHLDYKSLPEGKKSNVNSALIIGGTSEMGLLIADEYVKKGVRTLILHGRRPVRFSLSKESSDRDLKVSEKVQQLKSKGVEVYITDGDLLNPQTRKALLNLIESKKVFIDDFVFCAGTSHHYSLLKDEPNEFLEQTSIRSLGWRELVDLSNPNRVIFISSISSFFNSIGQAPYLFGNHVIDAWTLGQSDSPYKVISVLFPLWKDIGKAKEDGFLPETLLEHASNIDLKRHMHRLIDIDLPYSMVLGAADLANNNTRSLWKNVPFLLEGSLKRRIEAMSVESTHNEQVDLIVPSSDSVEAFLQELWFSLLGQKNILSHNHFFQMGGNSVLLAKLLNRLKGKFPEIKITVKDLIQNLKFHEQADLVRNLISDKGASEHPEIILKASSKKELYPASEEQKQIWIQSQLDKNCALYNLTGVYMYHGVLNVKAFEESVNQLAIEQEIFRTRYVLQDGAIFQVIDPTAKLFFQKIELDQDDALEPLMSELFQRESNYGFDLETQHPFRVFVISQRDKGAFLLNLHHIAADGWALGYYTRRLNEVYSQIIEGVPTSKQQLELTYKDYSVYQQENYLDSDKGRVDEQFWLRQLKDHVATDYLELKSERPDVFSFVGTKWSQLLPKDTFDKVRHTSQQLGVSLFAYLQASLGLLLSYESNKENITTGTPFSTRVDKRLEHVVGNFVNILPVCLEIPKDISLATFIKNVQVQVSDIMNHQQYPFNKIVQNIGLTRDPSRHPVFDILFVLQNHEEADFKLKGLEIERRHIDPEHSKLDLFIEIREKEESLEFNFEYNKELFNDSVIRNHFLKWKRLLDCICLQLDDSIDQLFSYFRDESNENS